MTSPRGVGVTPERAEAAKSRERLAAEREHLSRQRNLTARGWQARDAKATERTRTELSELLAQERQRLVGCLDGGKRRMFGHVLPGDSKIISIRDAADRASRVSNPDEAATLMNLAEMNGDEVLLKALARECAERANPLEPGYGALFTQWASNQPGGSETLDEMAMIIHEFSDPGARLVRESVFSVGPLPGHLRGISDLRALAAEADDTSGVLPPTSAQKTGDHLSAFVRADIR